MNEFKSPVSRLARLFRKSRDAWKAKALDKQRRLRAAQVRIRDLEKSRAYWKARAQAAEDASRESTSETGGEAKPVEDDEEKPPASPVLLPPAHHRYSLLVMQLALQFYLHTGLGSRGVSRVLGWLTPWLPVDVPVQTTVLNWVYRCGLVLLQRLPERRDDWIFVADHTLALGTSKCLLVLGIPAARLPETGYSPSHRDMQVLAVKVASHSTGEWVAGVIEQVAERTGQPVQIVADHGSDLHKGIGLFQHRHAPRCVATYDISHRIATLLKAELGEDARHKALLGHCAQTRTAFQQTDLAFLLPPRQRTKARFMHVEAQIQWARRLLDYFDRGDFSDIGRPCAFTHRAWSYLRARFGARRARPLKGLIGRRYDGKPALCQDLHIHGNLRIEDLTAPFWDLADTGRARFLEAFAWVLSYRHELPVYEQMLAQSNTVQTVLKTRGLSAGVYERLHAELSPQNSLTPRAAAFTNRLLEHVAQEADKIPPRKTWLASSDIIESVFGTYKTFTERGPLKEIGKLVLTIPACLTELTASVIREAMETVRTADVEQWVKTHLGDSMLARRRRALRPAKVDMKTA